jgi:hypothetical protein
MEADSGRAGALKEAARPEIASRAAHARHAHPQARQSLQTQRCRRPQLPSWRRTRASQGRRLRRLHLPGSGQAGRRECVAAACRAPNGCAVKVATRRGMPSRVPRRGPIFFPLASERRWRRGGRGGGRGIGAGKKRTSINSADPARRTQRSLQRSPIGPGPLSIVAYTGPYRTLMTRTGGARRTCDPKRGRAKRLA